MISSFYVLTYQSQNLLYYVLKHLSNIIDQYAPEKSKISKYWSLTKLAVGTSVDLAKKLAIADKVVSSGKSSATATAIKKLPIKLAIATVTALVLARYCSTLLTVNSYIVTIRLAC